MQSACMRWEQQRRRSKFEPNSRLHSFCHRGRKATTGSGNYHKIYDCFNTKHRHLIGASQQKLVHMYSCCCLRPSLVAVNSWENTNKLENFSLAAFVGFIDEWFRWHLVKYGWENSKVSLNEGTVNYRPQITHNLTGFQFFNRESWEMCQLNKK